MSEFPPRTIDGGFVKCDFETWVCSNHSALAGGFDEHHRRPKSMGGPENPDDKLILCPTHHRRQHALVRAYVEHGPNVQTVKWYSPAEKAVARFAYQRWSDIGRPHVQWSSPAAAVVL